MLARQLSNTISFNWSYAENREIVFLEIYITRTYSSVLSQSGERFWNIGEFWKTAAVQLCKQLAYCYFEKSNDVVQLLFSRPTCYK